MSSPLSSHRPRPITRPSGGALANDESDAAPNRGTSESDQSEVPRPRSRNLLDPCPSPGWATSTPFALAFRSGPPPDAPISLPGRSWGYMGSCSTRGTPTGSCPMWLLPDSTSSAVFCPAMSHGIPIPNPIPAQPSPGPVWSLSLSLARSLPPGAIYGRSGWIDEGFFLARTPSPPYLAPRYLVAASRPRHHFAR